MKFLNNYSQLLLLNNKEISLAILNSISLLIQNIRNKQYLYYFYSSQLINELITTSFNDENYLAYQMSFIKSLALKLETNHDILFLFFDINNKKFPLLSKIISFYNSNDEMVRNHGKNSILNILKIKNEALLKLFFSFPMNTYFINIIFNLKNTIMTLVTFEFGNNNNKKYISLSEDLLEILEYINDLLSLNIPDIETLIINGLLIEIIFPIISILLSSKQEIMSPMFALYIITLVYLVVKNNKILSTIIEDLIFDKTILESIFNNYIKDKSKFDCIDKEIMNRVNTILKDNESIDANDEEWNDIKTYLNEYTSQQGPFFIYNDYNTNHKKTNNEQDDSLNLLSDYLKIENEIHKTFLLFYTSKDELFLIIINLLMYYVIQRNIENIPFFINSFFDISNSSNKLLSLLLSILHNENKSITLTSHLILININSLISISLQSNPKTNVQFCKEELTNTLSLTISYLTDLLKNPDHCSKLLKETVNDLAIKTFDIYSKSISNIILEPTNLPYLSIPFIYSEQNSSPKFLHDNKTDCDYFIANLLSYMYLYDIIQLINGNEKEMIKKGNFQIGIEDKTFDIGEVVTIENELGDNYFSCMCSENEKGKSIKGKIIVENEHIYIALLDKNKEFDFVIQYIIPLRRLRVLQYPEDHDGILIIKDLAKPEKEYWIDVITRNIANQIIDILRGAKENAISLNLGIIISLLESSDGISK